MVYIEQKIKEFTYTNAVNPTPLYDLETEYVIGDLARVDSKVYKSTLESNLGNDPLENLNIYWIEWLPANDYAILDLLEETKTEWDADGIVEFTRGRKDTIGIGNFKAKKITIQYLDSEKNEVGVEEYDFSANGDVWNEWDYGYEGFTDSVDKAVYVKFRKLGTYIRITFSSNGGNTNCGFMVAGEAEDMGTTMDDVSFPDKRLGDRTVNTASFDTKLQNTSLMRRTSQAKKLIDVVMLFVIDPSENSLHDNMIILGKITKCDATASQMSKNKISWQIDQMIQE